MEISFADKYGKSPDYYFDNNNEMAFLNR
jgi:hypothetical protein